MRDEKMKNQVLDFAFGLFKGFAADEEYTVSDIAEAAGLPGNLKAMAKIRDGLYELVKAGAVVKETREGDEFFSLAEFEGCGGEE